MLNKELKQKYVIIIFSLFILLGIVFSFCIYNQYYCVKKISINNVGNSNILFNIDDIKQSNKEKIITIKGWTCKKHEDLKIVKTYVVLKKIESSELFQVNTGKESRKDVTSYFNDSYDYDNSGFLATFDKNALKGKGKYEICILYLSNNNKDFIATGKFIDIN